MLTAGTDCTAQEGAESTERNIMAWDCMPISTVAVDLLLSCGCCLQVLAAQHKMELTAHSHDVGLHDRSCCAS